MLIVYVKATLGIPTYPWYAGYSLPVSHSTAMVMVVVVYSHGDGGGIQP